jgi:hypothetical protein
MDSAPNTDRVLQVQLLCWSQDASVLQLLRFATIMFEDRPIRARVFTGGRSCKKSYVNLNATEHALATGRLNSVRLRTRSRHGELAQGPLITSVRLSLDIAPTNTLWDDARMHSAGSINDERVRISLESLQINLVARSLKHYPSALTVVVIFEGVDSSTADRMATDWLRRSLEAAKFEISLTGVADLNYGREPNFWTNYVSDLTRRLTPGRLPAPFDDLHWGMIGSQADCETMALGLGGAAECYGIMSSSPPLGLLRLKAEAGRLGALRNAIHTFLEKPAPLSPTLEKGRRPLVTLAEYEQLDREGRKPRLTFRVLHLLIGEHYCRTLSIEPRHMLVVAMNRQMSNQITQEVSRDLGGLPPSELTREAIVAAHERVLRKYMSSSFVSVAFDRLASIHGFERPPSTEWR